MPPSTLADGDENRTDGDDDTDASIRADLLEEWSDLTAFKRDLLAAISDADGRPYGLELKADLGRQYGEEVNHGHLYTQLTELAAAGYIIKAARDDRTNEYALTSLGAAVLAVGADRLDTARSTPRDIDLNTVLESDLYE